MLETSGTRAYHKDILKYLDTEKLIKYGTVQYYGIKKIEKEKVKKPKAEIVKQVADTFIAYLGENGIVLEGGRFFDDRKYIVGKQKPELLHADEQIERIYIDKEGVHFVQKDEPDYILKDKINAIVIAADRRARSLRAEEEKEKHYIRNFFKKLFSKEQEKKLPETISTFLSTSAIERILANVAHEEFELDELYKVGEIDRPRTVNERFLSEYEWKKEHPGEERQEEMTEK